MTAYAVTMKYFAYAKCEIRTAYEICFAYEMFAFANVKVSAPPTKINWTKSDFSLLPFGLLCFEIFRRKISKGFRTVGDACPYNV